MSATRTTGPTSPSPAHAGGPTEFHRPRALAEALALLGAHAARGARPVLLAGGTDWMVERHMAPAPHAAPPAVIDVTGIAELRAIAADRDPSGHARFKIGAAVPYLAFRTDPVLREQVPMLAAMAREVGAVQIQARGTLGGNLATASPAADGVCALAALQCSIELASAARGTRSVAIESFFLAYKKTLMSPDELITAVTVTAPTKWFWRKVGTRLAQAISKVALAGGAWLAPDGTIERVALGMASVKAATAMLPRVRAELHGKRVADVSREAVVKALHADIAPIDDVRSTEAYRRHVAERLVLQFVDALAT